MPDARDVYCYTDFVGIDYTVMFSFTCDTASLGRIVRAKGLTQAPDELGGLGLQGSWDFDWWKKTDFKGIPPFHRGDGDKDRIYLWYDPISHKVTYQQLSL